MTPASPKRGQGLEVSGWREHRKSRTIRGDSKTCGRWAGHELYGTAHQAEVLRQPGGAPGATPGASRSHEGGVRGSPLISFARAHARRRRALALRSSPVLIAAIADTHLPRGQRRIPDACLERLEQADLILHAGDISTTEVLDELAAIGPPVKAVHGNVDSPDLRATLPEALEVRTPDGARIAMLHDAGPSKRRLERMRLRFPDANAVVFGHSHIPLHEKTPDGFQIFNPGSPTDRRRQPKHTMGLARTADGRVDFELLHVS